MPKKAHGEDPKEKATFPNIKTHEWLEKNKKLSLAEFTKRIRNERLEGLSVKPAHAYKSIKEAFSVCEENQKYVLDAVLEMKRNNVFESFLVTMLEHPEAVDLLASLLAHDENLNRKLNQAIFEMAVAESEEHDDDEGEEDEDDAEDEDSDEDEDEEDEEDEEDDEEDEEDED